MRGPHYYSKAGHVGKKRPRQKRVLVPRVHFSSNFEVVGYKGGVWESWRVMSPAIRKSFTAALKEINYYSKAGHVGKKASPAKTSVGT